MGVTLQDIARASGVSCATVSRVINSSDAVKPETREHVLETIRKYSYVPNAIARSLSRNETNTIGVVVPDILNPFFGFVIRGISTVLRNMGYNIALCDTDENINYECDSLDMLFEQRVRGIIISPTIEQESSNGMKLLELSQRKTPIVLVDRDIRVSQYDGVFFDNINAGKDATLALIQAGHQKVAAILGPSSSNACIERCMGYSSALSMNGLPYEDDYVLYGSYSAESGYEMTNRILLMKNRPTAIFAASNSLTVGCITCLLDHHIKIPEEMSVIGFDGTENFEPFGLHISYIDRSIGKMGEAAAKLMVEQINAQPELGRVQKRIIIPASLVLKGSEVYHGRHKAT